MWWMCQYRLLQQSRVGSLGAAVSCLRAMIRGLRPRMERGGVAVQLQEWTRGNKHARGWAACQLVSPRWCFTHRLQSCCSLLPVPLQAGQLLGTVRTELPLPLSGFHWRTIISPLPLQTPQASVCVAASNPVPCGANEECGSSSNEACQAIPRSLQWHTRAGHSLQLSTAAPLQPPLCGSSVGFSVVDIFTQYW